MMIDRKRKKPDSTNFLNTAPFNYTIPPINDNELKWLITDLLLKETFKPPFDSLFILRYIKKGFRNVDFSSYVISKLKINNIIRELLKTQIISCEEMLISMRRCYYIKTIDLEKLKNFYNSILDCKINQDFDKYLEKAKSIACDCMKETDILYDQDDIIHNSHVDKERDNYFFNENKFSSLASRQTGKKSNPNADSFYLTDQISVGSNLLENEELSVDFENPNLINDILYGQTAKNLMNENPIENDPESEMYLKVTQKMQSKYGSTTLRPFCQYGTITECNKIHFTNQANKRDNIQNPCTNVHFRPILKSHTDTNLGDCSYLDTCRHMDICKFVHYQIDDEGLIPSNRKELVLKGDETNLDAQWVNCDIRYFDYNILGKFDVIMADPPWDIHMDLPYGTLSDEEMKNLKIKDLQDDGVIFLWVTGRATELARECLELWGYERKEELVWIKTNQLQRLIRTGRTGHWLNHSKEHCLVGYKGNPKLNRNIDCDVLVSEVRETSRKPDEIYELIERMKPGGRKLELFARAHNRRKGWISLGNQLPGVYFVEEDLIDRFNTAYPESKLTEDVMQKNKESSIIKKII